MNSTTPVNVHFEPRRRPSATACRLACVVLISMGCARATTLVAGTNPDPLSGYYVENDPHDVFGYEQLFTPSTAAQITSLSINAGSLRAQTLRIPLFSGLGLEGYLLRSGSQLTVACERLPALCFGSVG